MPSSLAPLRVLLDLRPLQCAYARRGVGRHTYEIARSLAALCRDYRRPGDGRAYRVEALACAEKIGEGGTMAAAFVAGAPRVPGIPGVAPGLIAPRWKRPWLWDQTVLPLLWWQGGYAGFHNCVALGPLKEVNVPLPLLRRSVLTVQDFHALTGGANRADPAGLVPRRLRLQARYVHRAGAVLTGSAAVAREARARWNGRDLPKILTPVLHGVDHWDSLPETDPGPEPYLLSVGDAPTKNLAFAAEVVARVRALGFAGKWRIVGDPVRVRQALEPLGIPPWAEVGPAEDAELKGLYRRAAALLYPSTAEGFGLPPLEAAWLGCPVLASDIEPLQESLTEPGLTLPVRDAGAWAERIWGWVQNPESAQAQAQAGRRCAEHYTWKAAGKRVLAAWDATFAPAPEDSS